MPNQKTRQKKAEAAAAAAAARKAPAKAPPGAAPAKAPGAKTPPAPPPGGRQRGVCRWFVDKKKYGFISSGDGRDIFVHGADLKEPIGEGDTVEYAVVDFKGRPKAIEVIKICGATPATVEAPPAPPPVAAPPVAAPPAPAPPAPPSPVRAPSPKKAPVPLRRRGVCQWFTPKKKHGFIKPDGAGADVFVHEMDMRAGHTITEGDAVEFGTENYKGREKAIDVIKVDAAVRSAVAPPGVAAAPARRVLPPPRPWGAVDAGLAVPAPAVPPQNGAAPVFPKPSWAPPAAKAAAPAAPAPAPAAPVAAAPSWPRAAAPAAPAAPKPAAPKPAAPAAAPKPAGPRGWGQVDSAPSFASNDAGPTPGEAMRRA